MSEGETMNTNCALCAASGVETAGVLEVHPSPGWLGNLWKPGQTVWLCAWCVTHIAETDSESVEDKYIHAQCRAWVEAQDRLPCEVRGPDFSDEAERERTRIRQEREARRDSDKDRASRARSEVERWLRRNK